MLDISQFTVPKSDQINADDLRGGRTITVLVTKVKQVSGDQPIAIELEAMPRAFKPCKSMLRVLRYIWGNDGFKWVGKRMTLYCDDKVTWGGQEVGGVRISHMSDLNSEITVSLRKSKSVVNPYTVKPLSNATQSSTTVLADTATIKAGNEAAAKGVAEYVKWRDALAPEVKESVKSYNAGWSKVAKAFTAAEEERLKAEAATRSTAANGDDEEIP